MVTTRCQEAKKMEFSGTDRNVQKPRLKNRGKGEKNLKFRKGKLP